MKRNFFYLVCTALAALLYSCSGNNVYVLHFSPQGEIKNLTTFKIEFSKSLAPSDVLDKWLDDEFVKFEPKIEGKFKWISANTLIFSPDGPLLPIQSYKAEVTNKVLFKNNLSLSYDVFEFRTQDFDVLKTEFFWTHIPNEQYKISIKANIYFNYQVNPGMLKEYIGFNREGSEIKDFEIISDKASDVIAVDLGNAQQTDKEQEYSVIIKKGLLSVIGKKALRDTRVFKYNLPPLTKLAITGLSSGLNGDNKWIEVFTTQRVDDSRLKSYVNISPSKNLAFFVNDNSFRIEGDFGNNQQAKLFIKKGLPGLYGGELEFDFEQEVNFVNLDPSIRFTDGRGKYLLFSGQRNLELSAVNIPGVDIEVSHIYKNNVLYYLKQYSNEYDYYDEYSDYSFSYDYGIKDYGHKLYSVSKKLKNAPNVVEKFYVNLDSVRNLNLKGIYIINVSSSEDRWRKSSKLIALSDIGIIAKKSPNQLLVFANSIATTEPVNDVEITLVSSNNQVIVSGRTNSKGIAEFDNLKDKMKDFSPRIICAEKGGDFNFIDLYESGVETSRFDTGGQTEYTSGYKVFLYGDRNLYRPGDRVNISGIVRNDLTETIKRVPVLIKIISPAGKVYDEYKVNLNEEGSFEISFNMHTYGQTGQYRADVYTGSESLIGTYSFNVEDFVPDKIRVNVKKDKDDLIPGQQLNISIDAEYLFGAKASGLKYEADIQLRHTTYSSKKYPHFDFGNSSFSNPNIPDTFINGNLEQNGSSEIRYVAPADLQSAGVISGYAFISVFDLTGRTVNRVANFKVYPQKYFIGINSPGYYFSTNENINFKIIAVDKNDIPPSGFKAVAKLVRFEWNTVLKRNNSGHYFYTSEKKEVAVWDSEINISGGEKIIPVNVNRNGEYELRIFHKGSNYYQASRFYAYGWNSSTVSTFEVNKDGRIEIVFDKQSYEPGEKAKALFTTPFAGKMLVTMERNGVYDYKFVEVKNRSTQLEVEINDKYIPNIYITATLIKKNTSEQSVPFTVAHGLASVKIERKSRHLPVTILAPLKIKPNRKMDVTVKTSARENIFVTLAAVDEGILQIQGYKSPDPYSFMYAKRALDVASYDLYKLLLPEVILPKSPGGDETAKQLRKRTNPITTKRFNLLAVWSGILKTNSSGQVKIPVSIPDFNGEVRLMAVVYQGDSFGSSETSIKVADDLIIEPQIPRFLAPEDSLVMPVSLINTTKSSGIVNVNLKVEGPLNIKSSRIQKVSIKANSASSAYFVITTGEMTGVGKIILETAGLSKVKSEVNIAVRPASPYYTESSSGEIKNDAKINLPPPSGYLDGTVNASLTISKFPAVKFAKFLKYLVGYPYGCVEQTVSKLFPQLYFEDLAKLVAPEYYKTTTPVYFIQEGIKKLESMQLSNGALSYWEGETYSNWWGTVYAAHFLVEAKKAGFNVSADVLSKLLNYITSKAREKHTFDYVTHDYNKRTVRKIASKEIIYSLYVLATAGKGDIVTMNYYKSRQELVSNDCKYLLAGAFALMNNWPAYYEIIPKQYLPEKTDRLTGGSFDSEARANAIMLNVLLEVEPSNRQIPFIIQHLTQIMGSIYSTQDRSFAFLALGKAARLGAFYDVNVDVYTDGKKAGAYSGKDITVNLNPRARSITLVGSKQGRAYFFYNMSGVKKGKVKQFDSHLAVRRNYFDYKTGKEITGNQFYQGQLLVCKISLTGGEFSAENIVISDLLPSGFEIENPRLSSDSQLPAKYSGSMKIQYMDIRDDRLLLFTGISRGSTASFFYMLRVVNRGKFSLPAISAEAMYDGEINSIGGAGSVRVNENRQ